MSESVKVAVRVRPFIDRERKKKTKCIIEMSGNTTKIRDPEGKDEVKSFNYDYSYWSHDEYTKEDTGYLAPADKRSRYVDQKLVFKNLGKSVLSNAWKGLNCTLFAYGQTGSGKSYSMIGDEGMRNKGIVPMACSQIFQRIQKEESDKLKFTVNFSMIEIYNEKVRDLLQPKTMKGTGMTVREHQKTGFFVVGLTKARVNSYSDIQNKMHEGNKNRTIAATQMNTRSSRAHTLVQIEFAQSESVQSDPKNDASRTRKTSLINLVDLAGSERVGRTGATGTTLTEGAGINQSLSCLGNCINAIVKGRHVPFRDSTLTKLLRNALGGNSKTILIAALSPAAEDYQETLSTLRFAERVKSVRTQAVVNESPEDKLIRELRAEVASLKEKLRNATGGSAEEVAQLKQEIEDLIQRSQREIEDINRDWTERFEREGPGLAYSTELKKKRLDTCHLWNLNQDAILTAQVLHWLPKDGVYIVSSSNDDSDNKISMKGLGMQSNHAEIHRKRDVIKLKPLDGKVHRNGKLLTKKKTLKHNDRLLFGVANLFVLHHPTDLARMERDGVEIVAPSYDAAEEEVASGADYDFGVEDAALCKRIASLWRPIEEANVMSEEMDKDVTYEVVLVDVCMIGIENRRIEIRIKVVDLNGNEFLWTEEEFNNRLDGMQSIYEKSISDNQRTIHGRDPFKGNANMPESIGLAHVPISHLAYLMNSTPEQIPLRNYAFKEIGWLTVQLEACTESGRELTETPNLIRAEDLTTLIGKTVYYKVAITTAEVPSRFHKVHCRYLLYKDEKKTSTVQASADMNINCQEIHRFVVTQELLDYLCNENLLIHVLGTQKTQNNGETNQTLRERVEQLVDHANADNLTTVKVSDLKDALQTCED